MSLFRRSSVRLTLALALALALLPAWNVAPLAAATCVVKSTADSGPNTLREHLSAAGCSTITFALPGAAPWTITLASSLPEITRTVTVTGPGKDQLTIQGNNTFWLLACYAPSGPVALSGLTLTKGYASNFLFSGGNLLVLQADLTLTDVALTAGTAPANYMGAGAYVSGGTSTFTRVTISGNTAVGSSSKGAGAGLFVDELVGNTSLTISDSTIVGNTATSNGGGGIALSRVSGEAGRTLAVSLTNTTVGTPTSPNKATSGDGGGIYNQNGTLTLSGSTVSGNEASGDGGGIAVRSGSTIAPASATLTNTTISGNRAGGAGGGLSVYRGAYLAVASATLVFSTVTGNLADSGNVNTGIRFGGGISATDGGFGSPPSLITVRSSIVAGNRRTTTNASLVNQECYGNMVSQGYNVFGGGDCTPQTGTDRNLPTLGLAVSAVLAPTLADNGGPTQTHALVANLANPAVNRGDPTCVATDQRGLARPQGAGCDAGAYELPFLTLTTAASGGGTVSPAGSSSHAQGVTATVAASPAGGSVLTSWLVDGAYQGWPASFTLTMNASHSAQASFTVPKSFPDVGSGRPDYQAITALATRGYIKGFVDGTYGPDQGVLRAQMAALIARATLSNLAPVVQGCVLIGGALASWDCEVWTDQNFTDQGSVDDNLWRDVRTLAHYQVANGFGAGCAGLGRAEPCFGPDLPVTYGQTISFITRAMKAKGYWVDQPLAVIPYPSATVPPSHLLDLRTFYHYTKDFGAVPDASFGPATLWSEGQWNSGATRGWFAMALWNALNSYWSVDRVP